MILDQIPLKYIVNYCKKKVVKKMGLKKIIFNYKIILILKQRERKFASIITFKNTNEFQTSTRK